MPESVQKIIHDKWTWLTDYAYFSAQWTLQGESGRTIEVGAGISFKGKPRGGRSKCHGYLLFETYGIGALHVRVVDGEGACLIQLDHGQLDPLPLYSDPSLIAEIRKRLSTG